MNQINIPSNPDDARELLLQHALTNKEGVLADNGALVVETGNRTGRSPLDRFIVKESTTQHTIDWGNINRPFDAEKFSALWTRVNDYLSTKTFYHSELNVGADEEFYIPVSVMTETAWHQMFARNMPPNRSKSRFSPI